MEELERWGKMLNSVGTTAKIWTVFEEMKQEIRDSKEECDYYKRWYDNYVETNSKQKEKIERYEKTLKSIYEIIGYEDDKKVFDVLLGAVEKALKS